MYVDYRELARITSLMCPTVSHIGFMKQLIEVIEMFYTTLDLANVSFLVPSWLLKTNIVYLEWMMINF